MPLSKIQLPGKRSRAQELYEFLRNAIFDGTLGQNERLVEETIASLASVSRTPVREALHKLEVDNLVQDSGQGLVVVAFTADELADLCAVRETLEGMASRVAATSRTQIDVLSLREIHENYAVATRQQNVERLTMLNHAFHESIWLATRNRYLYRELANLRSHIERLQKTTLDFPARQQEALKEHELILEAIIKQDEEKAEQYTRQHFREAMAIRLTMQRVPNRTPSPHAF